MQALIPIKLKVEFGVPVGIRKSCRTPKIYRCLTCLNFLFLDLHSLEMRATSVLHSSRVLSREGVLRRPISDRSRQARDLGSAVTGIVVALEPGVTFSEAAGSLNRLKKGIAYRAGEEG